MMYTHYPPPPPSLLYTVLSNRLGICPRDSDFEAAAMDAFEHRAGPDRFKVKVREPGEDLSTCVGALWARKK